MYVDKNVGAITIVILLVAFFLNVNLKFPAWIIIS